MTSAVFYDEFGKITEIRGGPKHSCEVALTLEPSMTGLITEEAVGFDTHYVADGTLREMPPQPSDEHIFDYAARKWVHDPAPAHQQAMFELRVRRNNCLESCDWTQMPDAPLDAAIKAAWQTYRQQLRDLPSNYPDVTSIDDVEFPTPPSV